jgi:hypothetical protein
MNQKAVMTPTKHARFSPSGSSRWIPCPGSVPFCESLNIPRRESFYADEGTACHELAAHCLEHRILDASEFEGRVFYKDIETNREMINATDEYVAYVLALMECDSVLEVETRITMEALDEGMGGTGDAVIWGRNHLHVCDLKYGRGVAVEVEDNSQLMLYGAGRLLELLNAGKLVLDEVETVCMHIIQPRSPHQNGPCRRWECSIDTLRKLWKDAKEAIIIAKSDNPTFKAGEKQCKWCDGAAVCRTLANHAMEVAQSDFADLMSPALKLIQANTLTPEQMSAVLDNIPAIDAWTKAVQTFAHFQIERGESVPNYKLVRGRANRGWAIGCADEVTKVVEELGFVKDELYTEPKFKSPAQIETLIGKKKAAALSPFIVKPLGKISLAHISDKREAVSKSDAAAADFAGYEESSDE